MADPRLDILVVPTYNTLTLEVADASTYPDGFVISSPSLEIEIPGLGSTIVAFVPNDFNVLNSGTLSITEVGEDLQPLPDGLYQITYSVAPSYTNYVTKSIMRVEQLQEKFDEALMKLDMMECDAAIKKQQKVDLNTMYFLIQGSIAAANNCATDVANKLYLQAAKQLAYFTKSGCGCSGSNYLTNF